MSYPSSYSYENYLLGKAEGIHAHHIIEHAELSRRIAAEVVAELVPPMVEDMCLKIIKEYLNGNLNHSINYDVKSIANVSIKDFNAMFHSEAFTRFMSNAIGEEIRKRINEIEINVS